MDLEDIPLTCVVPKTLWIEDIILDLIKKLPAKLFDELRPWCSIITQYPFIHKFTIAQAMETIRKARNERTVLNEPLFPTDCRDSEDNLKQFLKSKPIRIMLAGDTNSSFDEINKLLAKDFNTYTISPQELIINEINQKSNLGKRLQNIVKTGKGVPVWVVMKLLEHELDSEKYATKGFILTGFPIVSSLTTSSGKYGSKNVEFRDLKSQSLFSGEMEDESPKDCIQRQLDFINNLGCRPDFFIYLDTHRYTKQFAEAIEIFQEFILLYFRENVIRIDCRIGTDAILSSIRNRFKYINFKVNYECFVMNESQSETMSIEELCDTEKVLPNYKWLISKFGQICPVNLYHGRLRLCDTKFPVRYLRNIFLFFSRENREEFIENPGNYMNLEPKCRVAVIGPHRTGKTTLSQYLARYLNAQIYKDHIQKSQEFYKFADLTRELKELNEKLLQENERCKQKKAEEWSICVLGVLNDILSESLNEEEKRSNLDVFSSKHAYQSLQTSKTSNSWTKAFLLEYLIFQKSFDNISSEDFLSWLESKPGLTYKQYVIDSAPLNLNFWKDLQIKDELPDCVFFLKLSSIEKLFDTYDYKHNLNCVNGKYISDRLRSKFEDFKNINNAYSDVSQTTHNVNRESFERSSKPLIKQRYIKALKFIEEYEEVQNFLQANNVKCVDIDISKHTWTQSVLIALTEFFSLYQPPAIPMHDFFVNESEENYGSISSYSDSFTNKETTESETGTYDNNYGHCLDWCPVSFNNQNILKKGNAQYSVEYNNKTYAVHSREHLAEFMLNPALYSRCNKIEVPPPRIFILGISYKNKTNFTEHLASSLNVQSNSYKQQPTTGSEAMEKISIQQFKESYNNVKLQFLQDLAGDYKRGTVLVGFPFLWEQFNDLIQRNIYPECVLSFNDEEEINQTFYRYFARLNMMQTLNIRVPVPDERFDFLCEYHKPLSKVPAYLNVVDIAGLVKGAAEGQGLGNAFLSHISACDAIFHLCRAFEDPDVTHVEGEVDPVRDLEIISEELRLKDEEKLIQNLDKLEKVVARGGDKKLKPEYDSMLKVKSILCDEKKHLRFADWNLHDIETLNKYMFLTTKPAIYLINLSDKDFIRKKNKWLAKIKEWVDKNDPGAIIIPFSGQFENNLAEKDETERKIYEEETKCKSVLDKIIVTGYKALQLEYFFTAGPDEVKAWTIQKGTKAPQAAGRIHTDFEKGFIMAEVMHFKDFKEEGSEAMARAAGKYRQQGRNYVVVDGDIIFFKFNAGAGLKDAKKK